MAPDLTELCVTALKARMRRQDVDPARAGDGWITVTGLEARLTLNERTDGFVH